MEPALVFPAQGRRELALLTPAESARADKAAMKAGVSGRTLMNNAGWSVATAVMRRFGPPRRTLVVCGPGNNGGDGFVAAHYLARHGWQVTVALLGERRALKGDAAWAASLWKEQTRPLEPALLRGGEVVVDALFGAGLSRPLSGPAEVFVRALNEAAEAGTPVVSVDVPSGLDGASGQSPGGLCVRAGLTVTFFRRKPGHLLYPGRAFCGEVLVADIGIPPETVEKLRVKTFQNAPGLFRSLLPAPAPEAHKYDRGHLMVLSGPLSRTGAARLAAQAGLRSGAGLVTLASPPSAILVNAAHLTAVMLAAVGTPEELGAETAARRISALVMGPALGADARAREMVLTALRDIRLPLVLDADALTIFASAPEELFSLIAARTEEVVLTPHEGEFARLFPALAKEPDKLARARRAAAASGAVVVLKGADTVIAAPSGEAAINANAPPALATAGSGDVLSGIVGGLLAQGMDALPAAAAAVWIHGEAARAAAGGTLIAEDLPPLAGRVLAGLRRSR